ncbi:SidA/IucD/PvdA family monooxygenase [Spirillospora sp. CA-255316]
MGNSALDPYDFIGVGFGPSNLALAVAAEELDPTREFVFFEQSPRLLWHPGMMIEGARMQISFLKDLATLRNPASPYTFLQYAKAKGRLEKFVNLAEFRITRLEYQDYLQWVAGFFAGRVAYSSRVTRVTPVRCPGEREHRLFRVEVENAETGERDVHYAANVVHAAGGRARFPEGCHRGAPGVIHSSEFLSALPVGFPDRSEPYDLAVVGDGQSAGEIVGYLLKNFPEARVHLCLSGYALRATDNNPFVNEQFYEENSHDFHGRDENGRAALLKELRNTNYGVVEAGFLDDLYRLVYTEEVQGRRRLTTHPFSRVTRVDAADGAVTMTLADLLGGPGRTLRCDGVMLATGYERGLDRDIFGEVLEFVDTADDAEIQVSPGYRVQTRPGLAGGLYVQGYAQHAFGLGDTLLSLLPFRSARIFTDICERTPKARPVPRGHLPHEPFSPAPGSYPPKRYVEDDLEKIFAIVERFGFATVISARGEEDAVVTHVPLTLDRSRGAKGVLFGHMDRANPHAGLIDGRTVTVLFHGPNAYISPDALGRSVLPTWNSLNVHARGTGRLLTDRAELVRGLGGICERSDPGPGAYRLDLADPRIDQIIGHIVGFEIEIEELTGRFKISQELDAENRRLAALEMASHTERGERRLLASIFGCDLTERDRDGLPDLDLWPTAS